MMLPFNLIAASHVLLYFRFLDFFSVVSVFTEVFFVVILLLQFILCAKIILFGICAKLLG